MAFFGVTEETVAESKNHPNADKLDITTLEGMGFQFITGRGQQKPGDEVLYFPIDSLIPDAIQEKLGILGRLSGKDKKRLKTVRLRGEISQGLVGSLDLIAGLLIRGETKEERSAEITKYLGIEKSEPVLDGVAGGVHAGGHGALPCPVYDIEGADRYKAVLESLMDQKVTITEKVEGTNFSATLDRDNKFSVSTHHHAVMATETCPDPPYHVIARENRILELLHKVYAAVKPSLSVTVYGEVIGPGIQWNLYKLKTYQLRLFDIRVDDRFMNKEAFFQWMIAEKCATVPLLDCGQTLRDILGDYTLQEYACGKSALMDTQLREGIVITPEVEQYSEALHGRLILKYRSPEYLASEK